MVLKVVLFRGTEWFCQKIPWCNLYGCAQKYHSVGFEPHEKVLRVSDDVFKAL